MSITFVDVDISGVVAALLLLKFEISLLVGQSAGF